MVRYVFGPALLALIFYLVGCATKAPPREYNLAHFEPAPGLATVVLYRPNKFLASMGGPVMLFDGASLGVFPNDSLATFPVSPGHHYLEAVPSKDWVGGTGDALSFSVSPGKVYFLKVYPEGLDYVMIGMAPVLITGFHLRVMESNIALPELSRLKDISSSASTPVGHIR